MLTVTKVRDSNTEVEVMQYIQQHIDT